MVFKRFVVLGFVVLDLVLSRKLGFYLWITTEDVVAGVGAVSLFMRHEGSKFQYDKTRSILVLVTQRRDYAVE